MESNDLKYPRQAAGLTLFCLVAVELLFLFDCLKGPIHHILGVLERLLAVTQDADRASHGLNSLLF